MTLLGAGQQGRQGRGGCDRYQLRQGQRHPRHGDAAMSRAIAQPAQGTQGLAVAAERWGMSSIVLQQNDGEITFRFCWIFLKGIQLKTWNDQNGSMVVLFCGELTADETW